MVVGAAALGVLLKATVDFQPLAPLRNRLDTLFTWLPAGEGWLEAHPVMTGWIAGPAVLGLLALTATRIGWVARLIDQRFPDPPRFVTSSLPEARERDRLLSLEGAPLPFVGRTENLAELDLLLDQKGERFLWRSLIGVSGIGKSRLAIEWLESARARGWDFGIVDRDDAHLLTDWRPRRPTALVVDDARRSWGEQLWAMLARLAGAPANCPPIRVLVTDQTAPIIDLARGSDRDAVQEAMADLPMRLAPLSEDDLRELHRLAQAQTIDETSLIEESAGRPRAALILLHAADKESYTAALTAWVERFVPGLLGDERIAPTLVCPLLLSALAGAIDTDKARVACAGVDTDGLVRFFADATAETLETRLPPLVPDDLAGEIVLQLLPRVDLRVREAIVDIALETAPAAVEARLYGLWAADPGRSRGGQDRLGARLWLQERFDLRCPERAAAQRTRVADIAKSLASAPYPRLAHLALELADIAAGRPFDLELIRIEARAMVEAMARAGRSLDLTALEQFGGRLIAIAEDPLYKEDAVIREVEAAAAANAIQAYRIAGNLGELDRWTERLVTLGSDERFSNLRVKQSLAMAAMSASAAYGISGDFDRLEYWGDVVAGLAEETGNDADVLILRCEAAAATNATHAYGAAGRLADLERWRERMNALLRKHGLARDADFCLSLVMTEINRMTSYGCRGGLEELEASGLIVAEICDRPEFSLNLSLLQHRIKAASTAIAQYSDGQRFDDLDRWIARLCEPVPIITDACFIAVGLERLVGFFNAITGYALAGNLARLKELEVKVLALLADPRMDSHRHARLMETYIASNIINGFGITKAHDDMDRWAQRCMMIALDDRFSSDPRIWTNVANAVRNAMVSYYEAGDFEAFARWYPILARIALTAPADSYVQEIADGYGVSASSQIIAHYPYGEPFAHGPKGVRPATDDGLDMRAAMMGVVDLL